MTTDKKLGDAELANLSGAGSEFENPKKKKPPPPPPSDGTNLDDAEQQENVGGGLTAPDLG